MVFRTAVILYEGQGREKVIKTRINRITVTDNEEQFFLRTPPSTLTRSSSYNIPVRRRIPATFSPRGNEPWTGVCRRGWVGVRGKGSNILAVFEIATNALHQHYN